MDINYFDVLEGTLMNLPEMQIGKGLWQNCHHCYDVHTHSLNTGRILAYSRNKTLVATGYLHDIGKPMVAMPVATEDGYREICPGVLCHTFPKHGEAGAYRIEKMNPEIFENFELDQERMTLLVEYHNTPLSIIKSLNGSDFEAFQDLLETAEVLVGRIPVDRMELFQLFKADTLAKGKICQDCHLLLKAADYFLEEPGLTQGKLYEFFSGR